RDARRVEHRNRDDTRERAYDTTGGITHRVTPFVERGRRDLERSGGAWPDDPHRLSGFPVSQSRPRPMGSVRAMIGPIKGAGSRAQTPVNPAIVSRLQPTSAAKGNICLTHRYSYGTQGRALTRNR